MAKLDESQKEDDPEPPEWLSSHPNNKERIAYMEKLVVEQNLDRYAYEGVYRHQHIKQLVKEKWQEYAKCAEKIDTIEEAKVCAGDSVQEKKSKK